MKLKKKAAWGVNILHKENGISLGSLNFINSDKFTFWDSLNKSISNSMNAIVLAFQVILMFSLNKNIISLYFLFSLKI